MRHVDLSSVLLLMSMNMYPTRDTRNSCSFYCCSEVSVPLEVWNAVGLPSASSCHHLAVLRLQGVTTGTARHLMPAVATLSRLITRVQKFRACPQDTALLPPRASNNPQSASWHPMLNRIPPQTAVIIPAGR